MSGNPISQTTTLLDFPAQQCTMIAPLPTTLEKAPTAQPLVVLGSDQRQAQPKAIKGCP